MVRIAGISASVTAFELISGQSPMARPKISHSTTPDVKAAIVGSAGGLDERRHRHRGLQQS